MKKIFGAFISFFTIFYSCSIEDNNNNSAVIDYEVDVQIINEGYNEGWCWLHPRAAKCEDENHVLLLIQPWVTSHSDFYQFLSEMSTKDGGRTWHGPTSLADSLGEKWENDLMVRICDVTPQWHQNSKKILATGVTTYYRDSAEFTPSPRKTCYFYYDPQKERWSSWKTLKMPDERQFYHASVGCSQWVDLPNGEILLPIYFLRNPERVNYSVTVLRCMFDGETLHYIEHGNILDLERERGFCEPQLIQFKGKYFLSLRNDINGMISVSDDGLHYAEPKEWMFNDSSLVYSENTQQHWVKSPKALFLVYTSGKRKESEGVFRSRAPLFIAQFDTERLCLIKDTEKILIPNKTASLGNFGAFDLSDNESWVTASESTNETNVKTGANGRVYVVKIKWK